MLVAVLADTRFYDDPARGIDRRAARHNKYPKESMPEVLKVERG